MLLLRFLLKLNYNFLVFPSECCGSSCCQRICDQFGMRRGRPFPMLLLLLLLPAEMINLGIVKVMKNCCGRVLPFKMATNFIHFLAFCITNFLFVFLGIVHCSHISGAGWWHAFSCSHHCYALRMLLTVRFVAYRKFIKFLNYDGNGNIMAYYMVVEIFDKVMISAIVCALSYECV